jgi:RND family efflux transporter MFP subunit
MRPLASLTPLLLLVACSAPPAAPEPAAAAPVKVAAPVPAAAQAQVRAIGRLEAAGEADLGFASGGVVLAVDVDTGDRVRAGQVLARLDTAALDAGVRQSREQLARAERDLARAVSLVERQLVPAQQRDDARTQVEVAGAALRAAEYSQRYGRIVAPGDGVVLARLAEPGEVVSPGQPVLRTSSEGKAWVLAVEVADRDAAGLQVGAAATVAFDAAPGREFEAAVLRIGGQAGASTGAIRVELQVLAEPGELRSGLVGKARIARAAAPGRLVPTSAVLRADGGQGWLMLAVDGRAQRREVTLGDVTERAVTVLEGLSDRDRVIVEGGAFLDDGAAIREVAAP